MYSLIYMSEKLSKEESIYKGSMNDVEMMINGKFIVKETFSIDTQEDRCMELSGQMKGNQFVGFTFDTNAFDNNSWLLLVYEILSGFLLQGMDSAKVYLYHNRICCETTFKGESIFYHLNTQNGFIYKSKSLNYVNLSVQGLETFETIFYSKSGQENVLISHIIDENIKTTSDIMLFDSKEMSQVILASYYSIFKLTMSNKGRISVYNNLLVYKAKNGLVLDVNIMCDKYEFLNSVVDAINLDIDLNVIGMFHVTLLDALLEVDKKCESFLEYTNRHTLDLSIVNNVLQLSFNSVDVSKKIYFSKITEMSELIKNMISLKMHINCQFNEYNNGVYRLDNLEGGIFTVPNVNQIWYGTFDSACKKFREEFIYNDNRYVGGKHLITNIMKINSIKVFDGPYWTIDDMNTIYDSTIVVTYNSCNFRLFHHASKLFDSASKDHLLPVIVLDVKYNPISDKFETTYYNFPIFNEDVQKKIHGLPFWLMMQGSYQLP